MPNPHRAPTRLNQEPAAVRWARKRSGLTQAALAKRAGLSRSLVVEIEGGTRNATDENLIKLAEAMNCPVVVLERKREPKAPTAAASPMPESAVRGDERAAQRGSNEDELPEVRYAPVERTA